VQAPKVVTLNDPLGLLGLVQRLGDISSEDVTGAVPFSHLVLDSALPPEAIAEMHQAVCHRPSGAWEKSNDAVEVKWRSNWQSEYDIPEPAREVVRFFNSGLFLRELSRVTGIPKLIADPYYSGGGFNLSRRGGFLDVHVDGNWHDAMAVHRRLNLILYLNQGWQQEWGGALGFYDETGEKLVKSIDPVGNRLVIFETHDKSFHGHPELIDCPEHENRTSIILYYYTSAPRPAEQVTVDQPHSALWKKTGWLDKRGRRTRA
jgi:hypothetical protein